MMDRVPGYAEPRRNVDKDDHSRQTQAPPGRAVGPDESEITARVKLHFEA
jgi:hypothetical protein